MFPLPMYGGLATTTWYRDDRYSACVDDPARALDQVVPR